MKQPLYLIRRENIRFIGPMNIKEFNDSFVRMDFGTQDEVCGSCGSWIVMDDRAKLKATYPEIDKILNDQKNRSWKQDSALNHMKTRQIETMEKRPLKRSRDRDMDVVPRKRSWIPSLIFLTTLLIFCASVYFANESGFFSRFKPDTLTPQIQELNALMLKDNPEEFLIGFEEKLPILTERVTKSKELFNSTMPMFRMFAFYTTGEIPNYPVKNLKGLANPGFDCTLNMFVKKWDEYNGGPYSFASGNLIPKNPWTKLLSWDPYWIKRRPAKGWAKPRSYHEGCLILALNATTQIEKQNPSPILKMVQERIIDQQRHLNIGPGAEPYPEAQSIWQVLSCMDNAATVSEINKCKQNKNAEGDFKRVVDEYALFQTVRAYILFHQNLRDESSLKELKQLIDKLNVEAGTNRPEYDAEKRFLQALLAAGGNYEQMNFDSGEVRLRP